jgi:hypothetical protein
MPFGDGKSYGKVKTTTPYFAVACFGFTQLVSGTSRRLAMGMFHCSHTFGY